MKTSTVQSFEEIRVHALSNWSLRNNEPYLLSFDVPTAGGRRQGIYLAEINTEDGVPMLRISSPVAPLGEIDPVRCLRFNWEQRMGYLAVNDLDGVPFLQLCENRHYRHLDGEELERLVHELGELADRLEAILVPGADIT